jgi:hypothetical protein
VTQQTGYQGISVLIAVGNVAPETQFPISLGATIPSFQYSANTSKCFVMSSRLLRSSKARLGGRGFSDIRVFWALFDELTPVAVIRLGSVMQMSFMFWGSKGKCKA